MMNLARKCGMLVAIAVLCFCGSASADIVTLDLLHLSPPPKGYSSGTDSIFPYAFSINGSSKVTNLACDDFIHGTKPNPWTATRNAVPDVNASNSYFFSKYGMAGYVEAAFLVEELYSATTQLERADLQWALWAIFDPVIATSGRLTPTALADYNTAKGHSGDNPDLYSDVWVYTPVTNVNGVWDVENPGVQQEFMGVPETRTSTLLGAGLVGLVALML